MHTFYNKAQDRCKFYKKVFCFNLFDITRIFLYIKWCFCFYKKYTIKSIPPPPSSKQKNNHMIMIKINNKINLSMPIFQTALYLSDMLDIHEYFQAPSTPITQPSPQLKSLIDRYINMRAKLCLEAEYWLKKNFWWRSQKAYGP